MELNQEQADFEKHFRSLVGLCLRKVEYLEINYHPDKPSPEFLTKYERLHSIDFAVLLHGDQDPAYLCWDDQFCQFGIGAHYDEMPEVNKGIAWDVSTEKLWAPFCAQTITAATVYWESLVMIDPRSGKQHSITYPQSLRLDFDHGKSICLSAAELPEFEEGVYTMMDNLLVTDDAHLARQLKLIS